MRAPRKCSASMAAALRHRAKHRPGLLGPDQKTVEWRDVAPEVVPGALETHKPVCWDCHIAETFRREHPGLVTDRNWKRV